MPQLQDSPEEITRRGQALYDQKIRERVEPDHRGEFLVLDVETGEYEIDADRHLALDRAQAKHPDGLFYILRIGYPTAVKLGGRFRVSPQ